MHLASLFRPLVALALTSLVAACGVNTIPTYEEEAKAAWSQVQNQYQRRADLVPNLVETVKGFAAQERDVLMGVVEARAKATQTSVNVDPTDPEAVRRFQEAQGELGAALGRLIAITENYPDLKSNQNFLALQSQLEGTENRIAVSRRDYIEAIRRYNTELKTFPGRLWASTLYAGYEPMVNFETAPENASAPRVDFGAGRTSPSVDFGASTPANENASQTPPAANQNAPSSQTRTTGN